MFKKKSIVPVAVIMGSKNDWNIMKNSCDILQKLSVSFYKEVISAHRTPDRLFSFAESAAKKGFKIIIAGAGGSAHLPGMLASKTLVPVLGVPINSTVLNGIDSLYSIVQMPGGIPVGTLSIGKSGAINAALLASQILSIYDKNLQIRLQNWRNENTKNILKNSQFNENS
ncbi:5-(carboxyamino)imidazole ribonucleotide mutase [Candidatus Tachikawaea gelatinosa]|uniref:N5-carboxyaminoimidazole ribonucleotide mutase n=1 Tax=Candidatus Tachikawaea gelatinosa TaxID=1410383 RepID=A0A090BWK0_9ENTR|nr:5-(carboxyamino)imidazole ribonucleotide mutase [Candidatus Tachikawaea gelatinosa]BAP58741.1 N5-carboxyaminoimidazole ribonucleotide mutase [Candidatus Tachikawaea gelatinosa]